jgi:hypothetical protein
MSGPASNGMVPLEPELELEVGHGSHVPDEEEDAIPEEEAAPEDAAPDEVAPGPEVDAPPPPLAVEVEDAPSGTSSKRFVSAAPPQAAASPRITTNEATTRIP